MSKKIIYKVSVSLEVREINKLHKTSVLLKIKKKSPFFKIVF